MNKVFEENMKRMKEEDDDTKEALKKINVDAIAKLLINIQDENYKIKSEQLDLKRMTAKVTQDLAALRAEINVLNVMGNKGILGGTGSTVHYKDELI